MKERDHQSTWLWRWSVGIQTMMVDELGCCNACVERAYRGGEGHRADAWEKLGQESGKQQAFVRGLEHHSNIMKHKGGKNCVLRERKIGSSSSYKDSRVNPTDCVASVWSNVSWDILTSTVPNKAIIQRVHGFFPRKCDNILVFRS